MLQYTLNGIYCNIFGSVCYRFDLRLLRNKRGIVLKKPTGYFGPLTRKALQKYESGSEAVVSVDDKTDDVDTKKSNGNYDAILIGGLDYRKNKNGNLIDKTFSKLREVTIGYVLPETVMKKTAFKAATISFVGRNLFYFQEKQNRDVDLDQYAGSQTSTNLQTPTVRRFGLNINLVF